MACFVGGLRILEDDDAAVMPNAMREAMQSGIHQLGLLIHKLLELRREAINNMFVRSGGRSTGTDDPGSVPHTCKGGFRRLHAMTRAHP